MSKYMQPGDADAMRILQAELQKAQKDSQDPSLDANSRARAQADIGYITREIQGRSKRTGTSSQPQSSPAIPGGPDASNVLAAAGAANPRAAVAASGGIGDYVASMIRSQMGVQDTAIKAQQGAVTRQYQADAATTAKVGDRNNAINTNRLDVQARAGLGPLAQQDMYALTMQALTQNDQQYAVERAKYDEMASKNLIEDPLGWIMSQFTIGSQAAKVNALAAKEARLTGELERNMNFSEKAETTIQIDTRQTDLEIADFQARKTLAEGEARAAALSAEAARANMTAAALYGGELRKDQKQGLDSAEDAVRMRIAEERLRVLEAERNTRENIKQFTGSPEVEKNLGAMPKEDAAQIEAFSRGGEVSPRVVVKYGNGMKGTPVYNTAVKLQDLVEKDVSEYARKRGSSNPTLAASVTHKAADDQQVAWNDVRTTLLASNTIPAKGDTKALTLTSPRWDSDFNPLRTDHWAFADDVKKRATVGMETPVSPRNLLVHMFAKTADYPNARSKATGQVTTEFERDAVLGAVANMAVEGTLRGADGKPISTAGYAAMVSEYYRAASDWNQQRNQLDRLGFPKQDRYIASVPVRTLDGTPSVMAVDLTRRDQVERWLEKNRQVNAQLQAKQKLEQQLFEQLGNMPPARF